MTDTNAHGGIIERYLAAVAAQLPVNQREDIVEELRDLILSKVEAREEGLGRAATDAEKEDVLREIGHPLVVAARYRKGPDSLIGPELFPYWLFGMKAGLIILAVAFAINLVLRAVTGSEALGQSIGQSFQGYFGAALTLTGVLTLIGAVMEHQKIRPRWLTHWRVTDLGAFNITDPAAWNVVLGQGGETAPDKARSAFRSSGYGGWPGSEHVAGLLFSGLFVLWWLGLIQIPGLGVIQVDGQDVTVSSAQVWTTLFLPILAYGLGVSAVHLLGLVIPQARRLLAGLGAVTNLAGLWLLLTVWNAGHWFNLGLGESTARIRSPGYLPSLEALRELRHANEPGLELWAQNLSVIVTWIMVAAAIAMGVELLRNLWRMGRG